MYFSLNMHIILFKNIKNVYNFIRFEASISKNQRGESFT